MQMDAKAEQTDQLAARRPGLTSAEASALRETFGSNSLPELEPTRLWRRFLQQFQSPLIYILLLAACRPIRRWLLPVLSRSLKLYRDDRRARRLGGG